MHRHLIPLVKAEDFPLSLDDTPRIPLLHFSLIPPHLLSTTDLHQHQHRSGTSHWSLVASQQFRLRAALSICFFETLDLQKSPTYTAMCGVHTCGGSSCVWWRLQDTQKQILCKCKCEQWVPLNGPLGSKMAILSKGQCF